MRQLDWREFEEMVGAAYRRQGYTVLPTSPGADGGIDLILTRGTERVFVQCKHWKAWQVGAPVIRELFGLVVANQATRGIVVTSGSFSREAIEFARQTGTELLDGPTVLALVAGDASRALGSPQTASFPPLGSPASASPDSPGGDPSCPVCLSPMVLRKARRGAQAGTLFWGCTRYPGCRGTREAVPGTQLPPTPRQLARQRRERRKLVLSLVATIPALLLVLPVGAVMAGNLFRTVTTPPARFVPSASTATPSTSNPAGPGAHSMGEQPMDLAVEASGKRLYTANYVSGDVTVIDTASMSVLDTIDVPGKPVSLAVSGGTLYVADRAGKKIHAIDLKTRKTTATFATGRGTSDLAVDAGAGRLFVSDSEDGNIRVYSLSSRKRIGTIDSGTVGSIAVDTADHKLHTIQSLAVLVTYRTRTLARTATDYLGTADALAVDSKRQRLYVVRGSRLQERNLLTRKSRQIDLDIDAQSVAVDPNTRVAYVADPATNAVQAVSLK